MAIWIIKYQQIFPVEIMPDELLTIIMVQITTLVYFLLHCIIRRSIYNNRLIFPNKYWLFIGRQEILMTRQLQLLSHTCPCGLKLLEKSHKKLVSWPMLIYDFFFFFFIGFFAFSRAAGIPRGGSQRGRFPGQGSNQSCSRLSTPEPQQCGI